MTFVTVFRLVPRPITGMIGIVDDSASQGFEAHLDWLETTGLLVERFDPSTAAEELTKRPAIRQLLLTEGDRVLPLVLIGDQEISRGRFLNRTQLARAVGLQQQRAVVRQVARLGAAAALGSTEHLLAESARAQALGLSDDEVKDAVDTANALMHDTRSAV